jgi:hypothetical protein
MERLADPRIPAILALGVGALIGADAAFELSQAATISQEVFGAIMASSSAMFLGSSACFSVVALRRARAQEHKSQ